MEYGAGPRAAPSIDNGKAFCLNAWGELFCLRMADGHAVWKKHLSKEFGQKTPAWGYCVSPLAADGKLLVSPGGKGGPVAALDPETGELLWTGAGRGLNYANLTVNTFGGVPQVVGYDDRTAGGWDLKTGRRLWTRPMESAVGYVVPSAVAVHGRLLLTSDQEGARLCSFDTAGAIEDKPPVLNEDVAPDISTPTLWGETVLCASAALVLVDASPANPGGLLKTLWIYDAEDCVTGICHTIVSQDRALVMCEDGQVLLLQADRGSCRILDRAKLCGDTWVHPALAGGRFYVRDRTRLYCYGIPAEPD
jgi:outer membrane protein assembly factor BamB